MAVNGMRKECQHSPGVGASCASGDLGEQVGMNFVLKSSGSLGAQEAWGMRKDLENLSCVW